MIDYAQRLIEPTAIALCFKNVQGEWIRKKWQRWYYRRFLGDHPELRTGSQRPLDIHRAKWRTSENIAIYYNNARDAFVEAGIAKPNPAYDATDLVLDPALGFAMPLEEELIYYVTRTQNAFSFDETRVKTDTHDGSKR